MADSTPLVLAEIIAGDALGLGATARLLPAHRGEGRASATTIWRWITLGTRTADGRVVRLEAARVGGRWLTSRAALGRYAAALTPPADPRPTTPVTPTRTVAARQRASERANADLERRGA
jgi:hypothetical protein